MSGLIFINTYTENQTYMLGQKIGEEILRKLASSEAESLKIGFCGDLGAGKTILIKGIVSVLDKNIEVSSPTYTIINEYDLKDTKAQEYRVLHADLYRINNESDLDGTGFWEALEDKRAVMLVEWIDRLALDVDNGSFSVINISYDFNYDEESKNKRMIRIKNKEIFSDD